MGKATLNSLLLLILSSFFISSGTLVGFSYAARTNSAAATLLKLSASQIRVFVTPHALSSTGVSVDVCLNQSETENLRNWLKTLLRASNSEVKINSIIVSCRFSELPRKNELQLLYSSLENTYSFLSSLQLENSVKLSAAFPLTLLENLSRRKNKDLSRVLQYLRKIRSFVSVEADIGLELSMEGRGLESIMRKASLVTSILSQADVPIALMIKSSSIPSSVKLGDLRDRIRRCLKKTENLNSLLLDVPSAWRRTLLSDVRPKTSARDSFDPPTTTTNLPPYTPTPTIVTVPATIPSTFTPTNPAALPVTVPSTTPVSIAPATPLNSPVPVTNPASPITNPVTTYPAPTGVTPPLNPVTAATPPPVSTNTPVIPGQTWCVARSGVLESALQAALDYACGIGGADCSTIQEGASCFNPNSLENHASYAFNSYFQKNPSPSSCDFGGTAVLVNTNPSYSTCIYPSSSTTTTTTTSPSTTTPPAITTPAAAVPAATTSSTTGAAGSNYNSPPVFNSSTPSASSTNIYGSGMGTPPPANTTPFSGSADRRPFVACITLMISFTLERLVLG